MLFVPVDVDFTNHPKFLTLKRLVNEDKFAVAGKLIAIWSYAVKFFPDGIFDNFDFLPEIFGTKSKIKQDKWKISLETSKFIERVEDESGMKYKFHNWEKFAGKLKRAQEKGAERQKKHRQANATNADSDKNRCKETSTQNANSDNVTQPLLSQQKKSDETTIQALRNGDITTVSRIDIDIEKEIENIKEKEKEKEKKKKKNDADKNLPVELSLCEQKITQAFPNFNRNQIDAALLRWHDTYGPPIIGEIEKALAYAQDHRKAYRDPVRYLGDWLRRGLPAKDPELTSEEELERDLRQTLPAWFKNQSAVPIGSVAQ